MLERKVVAVALSTALAAPLGTLRAQFASSLDVGSLVTSGTNSANLPLSVLQFTPSARFESPYVRLSATGSAWMNDQQTQLADGIVSGTFVAPTVYGVRAELITNASRAFNDLSRGNDQVDLETRVSVPWRSGGVWVAGGVAKPWRIAVVSAVDVSEAGAWLDLNGARLRATYTNYVLAKTGAPVDSTGSAPACVAVTAGTQAVCSQTNFGDLVSSLHWAFWRLEIDALGGHRFGSAYDVTSDTRQWASGTATIWLNDRWAFFAGGGRAPANPARGIPPIDFGTAGLTLAYWPIPKGVVPVASANTVTLVRAFEARATTNGMERIVIRVGGVESVEIMGDFTDWNATALTRHGRDLWELAVPVASGVHQINLRVDGGPWVAPPGLPTLHDNFSGDVGVLVVP